MSRRGCNVKSGNRYVTPFYECFGCSVMFRDPVSFSGMCIRPNVDTSDLCVPAAHGARVSTVKRDDDAEK